MSAKKLCPETGQIVFFSAATVLAQRIRIKDKRIHVSKAHRGVMATIDNGRLIIDQKWYS